MTNSSSEQSPAPLIKVRNLKVAFGRGAQAVPVVHGTSFDLSAGECLAIVGESGSGKSVTARSLIGLTGSGAQISADALEFQGRDLRRATPGQWRGLRGSGIGYILQDALVSLDPLRTIGREIEDSLRLHTSMDRAARRRAVLQLLEDVKVPEPEQRINQRSGELSGGLRQRALIASAVALRPPVLVADEPTTALDATVQKQILELLKSYQDSGTALLLISHDLGVVADMADRILVMRRGEVLEAGSAAEVLNNPRHDYTRRLIQAIPASKPRGTRLSPDPVTVSDRQRSWAQARRAEGQAVGPGDPVLVANELGKSFRNPDGSERAAVDGVSFVLGPGTTLGIVGESGSGKSTVARMALGLLEPDSGSVSLLGRPWSGRPEKERRSHRRQIASIYQDPLGSFDPLWTVSDILVDSLPDRSLSKKERVAGAVQLLESVGLSPALLERSPQLLSGGQRQRIAIARTLAAGPRVIVCDEPVSALDVSVQAQVLDLLDELQREFGLSYLFISHDLGVIQHVSDEILVMAEGRVVEAGRAEEVFGNPRQDYTKALLAAAPRLNPVPEGAHS